MVSRRIIVVLIEPPVPFGGAAARWYYVLLNGLLARGHDVTTFIANCREEDAEELQRWFPKSGADLRCFRLERTAPSLRGKLRTLRQPHSFVFNADFRRHLDAELARPFDVLHLEQHWTGWLGLRARASTLLNVHYLYDIDLERTSVMNLRDAVRLHAERRLLRHFPVISAVTPRLAGRVAGLAPKADVHCVPLVLDLSLYPWTATRQRPPDASPIVGLIGSFAWGPSYTAARRLVSRLWPAIRREVPSAKLHIIGRAARLAVAGLTLEGDVSVLEDVPDAMLHFRNLDVMLYAPERGSGAKVKVLEAFALGTPVVTTSEGVEGIDAIDGVHAGVADSDEALVSRTVALLRDRGRADAQRRAARTLLEQHSDPRRAIDRVEAAHDAVLMGRVAVAK